MCQNLFFVQVLNVLQPVYNLQIPWEMDWKQRPRVGKGICRHARRARPQDFRLFSKSDTPFQHFLCPTGSGPDYNFINSGCPFHNAPQILAKGVGFSWIFGGQPTILGFVPTSAGWCPVEWGGGSPNIFDPPPEKYCEYRTTQIIGLFSFSMQILWMGAEVSPQNKGKRGRVLLFIPAPVMDG